MAGNFNIKNANGKTLTIQNPDTNNADIVINGSTIASTVSPEFTGTPTVNGVSFSGYSGFKNYIINGGFDIWQRGISQTIGGYCSADRWFFGWAGGALSIIKGQYAQPAPYNQYGNYALLTATSLVSGYSMYKVEDVRTLAGRTVTLSYCYNLLSGTNTTPTCYIRQSFGSGGSSDVDTQAVSDTTTLIGTNQYRRTLIFNVPSTLGKTIGGGSSLAVVTGYAGTFVQAIWSYQLEEGSVATPFEQRPYGLELSLCQRYYQVYGDSTQGINIIGYSIAGQIERSSFMFPIQMIDNPNATRVGTWYTGNCSQPTIATKSKNGFSLQTIVAATGGFEYTCNGTGQYLIFEKEL